MQSSVFRLLLLIVLALGVLLLLRPGTINQLKSLADNFTAHPPAAGPAWPAHPSPELASPITAAAPASQFPASQPGQENRPFARPGETDVSDDAHAGVLDRRPPPLQITLPAPLAGPDLAAAGNVTVVGPPAAGDPAAASPNNPLRGLPPPPADQNGGSAAASPNGDPSGLPQGAGFAPAPPSVGPPPDVGPPPNANGPAINVGPPPADSMPTNLPPTSMGPGPQFQPPTGQPPGPPRPEDRPPDYRAADGYRPASVNPQVASGPVQEPSPASRPQVSPAYIPPPLPPPISVASLDRRGPSLSSGGPGPGSAPVDAASPLGTPGSTSASDASTSQPGTPGSGSADYPGGSTSPPGALGPASVPGAPGSASVPGATGSASVPGATGSAGRSDFSGGSGDPRTNSSYSPSNKRLCAGSEKVAQVGSQVILASDLKVAFNTWVEKQKKSKKPWPPEQIEQHRAEIEAALLREMTEEAMLYQDISRQVPEEGLKSVRDKVGEVFENEELPKRIKAAGCESRAELEVKLEKLGTSLEREKRTFVQSMLAQQWLQQQVKKDDEIFTPEEVFAYYRQHSNEFEHTARVKWEELMVRKSRHPRRDEAIGLLGHLGNQVLDGAKLEAVARAGSEGSTACDGGLHDWTTKGSLVSETLETAIFSLPVGQLSQIIETDLGFHIVRVVERQEQSVTPFTEAQIEIRNKIVRQRKKKQMDDYLAKLHERTPIWTKYDALMAQQPKASTPFER